MDSEWAFKNAKLNSCMSSNNFKALIKLSRNLAILEFSSANGYTSFSLDFECRLIRIIETENENQSHFFHFGLSLYPWYGYNDTDIILIVFIDRNKW